MTLKGKTTTDLKNEAIEVLGEERVSELLAANISVAHRAYSQAYQAFKFREEKAYQIVLQLKTLGVKA